MGLDEAYTHGGKAHIFKGLDGEWYMRLLAPNGEIIAATEGHKNYGDIHELWKNYFSQFILSDEYGEPL
jgi:hypothetical protein